jgi:HKD family nuclease
MKAQILIQSPKTANIQSVKAKVTNCVSERKFDFARVAVAYATVSGVRSLLSAFEANGLKQSRWLLGLDDYITQPGAIDLLLSLRKVEVRVASYADKGRRFHPKFYAFACSNKKNGLAALVGSTNLTATAFYGNGESAVLLQADSKAEMASIETAWEELWLQGHAPTEAELSAYAERYKKAAIANKKQELNQPPKLKPPKPKEVLTDDSAELDPSIAKVCWIECGNVTAMGRELELKAEQGLFFGLDPSGGALKPIDIVTSDGAAIKLNMKYQQNHMWRLQMNNNVPEVKSGLRPRNPDGSLGRSPYVAVFSRAVDQRALKLSFLKIKSKEFRDLRKRTVSTGTLGATTTREYGWCL